MKSIFYLKLKSKPKLLKNEQNVPFFSLLLTLEFSPPLKFFYTIHMGDISSYESDNILPDFLDSQGFSSEWIYYLSII